ncbi:hypothetical protein J5N97_028734 [Dioscorea zingiberensis]|uniref:Uncharacterized protein n=1 Tax=Dioscorea zingiberensis TaxID=325984 RepID=A0A9D5BZZ7_9LILI|nr:hypothetical protein J5N97_028734 [Dioscorea zingiberensis]
MITLPHLSGESVGAIVIHHLAVAQLLWNSNIFLDTCVHSSDPFLQRESSSEYFTILLYYIVGDVSSFEGRVLAGYADYCCMDKISRLEIIGMAKELKLDVEGCSLWWMNPMNDKASLSEIKDNADALFMAQCVDFNSREMTIYAKVSRVLAHNNMDEMVGSMDEVIGKQRDVNDLGVNIQGQDSDDAIGENGDKQNAKSVDASDPCGTSKHNEDTTNDPMDAIDSQVLEEHYQQVYDKPQQGLHSLSPDCDRGKSITSGGGEHGKEKEKEHMHVPREKKKKAVKKPPTTPIIPVLRPSMNDKPVKTKDKERPPQKKRKIWVPPGASSS